MKPKIFCKCCNKDSGYVIDLFPRYHLKPLHNLNIKEYYDRYIKKEGEGNCIECGSPTTFDGHNTGYKRFCSPKCINANKDVKNKMKSKFNSRTPEYKQEIINKRESTNIKKFGVTYFSQLNEIKQHKQDILKSKLNIKWKEIIEKTGNIFIDYSLTGGYAVSSIVEFKCNTCNEINKSQNQFILKRIKNNEVLCTKCNPMYVGQSIPERQVLDFISSHYNKEIIPSCRDIIPPLELDIYLPDLKLAFEFNGLYWHSELHKDKFYHVNKTEECERNGIQLIHIYQDDWEFKQDIIKSRILNLLGQSNKIYARKCVIREVSCKDTREFLEENHIQGTLNSNNNIGLYHNNELVSLMCFGKNRFKQDEEELLRFCNKIYTSVIGGASKLFKYYLKNNKKSNIISYADRNWSMGNLYKQLGFKLVSKTPPNYWYVNEYFRENRFKYRKSELIRMGFDPNKTEHEIMLDREMYRIYNAGNLKYKYIHNIQ